MRDLNRKTGVKLDNLKNNLENNDKLINSNIGRALLLGVKTIDFYNFATDMLSVKANCHIEEGY